MPQVKEREEASNTSEKKRMRTENFPDEFDELLDEGDGGGSAAHVAMKQMQDVGREVVQAFSGSNIGKVEVNISFFGS